MSAVDVTPSLQHAHSEAFFDNPPDAQDYGSKSSIYRWELQLDLAKLCYEVEFIKQQQGYSSTLI
jgi:hypothetical protein